MDRLPTPPKNSSRRISRPLLHTHPHTMSFHLQSEILDYLYHACIPSDDAVEWVTRFLADNPAYRVRAWEVRGALLYSGADVATALLPRCLQRCPDADIPILIECGDDLDRDARAMIVDRAGFPAVLDACMSLSSSVRDASTAWLDMAERADVEAVPTADLVRYVQHPRLSHAVLKRMACAVLLSRDAHETHVLRTLMCAATLCDMDLLRDCLPLVPPPWKQALLGRARTPANLDMMHTILTNAKNCWRARLLIVMQAHARPAHHVCPIVRAIFPSIPGA